MGVLWVVFKNLFKMGGNWGIVNFRKVDSWGWILGISDCGVRGCD